MRDTTLSWPKNLAQGFNSAHELLTYLQLPLSMASADADQQLKPVFPEALQKKWKKGTHLIPLLLQVLPQSIEMAQAHEFHVGSPWQERAVNYLPGLLHKYTNRVLITLTSACAVHCRYCFRRHFLMMTIILARMDGKTLWITLPKTRPFLK